MNFSQEFVTALLTARASAGHVYKSAHANRPTPRRPHAGKALRPAGRLTRRGVQPMPLDVDEIKHMHSHRRSGVLKAVRRG